MLLAQLLGPQRLGDRREAAHVAEEDRQLGAARLHVVAVGLARHLVDELRRHVLAEAPRELALGADVFFMENDILPLADAQRPGIVLRAMELPLPHAFDGRILDELFVEKQQAEQSSSVEGGLARRKLKKLLEV